MLERRQNALLESRGIAPKRTNSGRCFQGITIKPDYQ
jgi:hypothetical protein